MASCYIVLSKTRLLKDIIFPKFLRISTPRYRFCSFATKPLNEENPDQKPHLPTHERSRISGDSNPSSGNIEDSICRMMEDSDWSTRLQSSIRNLVPLFDHNLVSSVLHQNPNRALEFFEWVEESGFKHDRETHYKLIEILCKSRRLEDAKRILLGMSEKGIDYDEDLFILLVHGYAKSIRKWDIVKNCVKIFSKMEELGVIRTIKSYNHLLEVIVSENKYTIAEKLFDKMLSESINPSPHTYNLMISGFCRSSRVETANRFFQDMKNQIFLPDFVIYNTMINGYVHVKKMEEAEKLLMEMKEQKIEPLLVTYNSMINGYSKVKKIEYAEKLMAEMKEKNIEPNLITYNTMINGYTLVKNMDDAQKLVVEMKGRKIEPDLVTYVTMIKGYIMVNKLDYGLELFEVMKRRRFVGEVDVYSCLGRLKDDFDVEKMSDDQKNVLQQVEDYVERVELLAMRDAARELSELAKQQVGKLKMDRNRD